MADKTIPAFKILRGSVGVGTTLPSSTFHVYSDSSTNTIINLQGGSATNKGAYMNFFRGTTNVGALGTKASIIGGTSNDMMFYSASNDWIFYSTGERMRVQADGLVGIGTNAPAVKLHVNGGQIRVNEGTSGVAIGEYQSGAVIWLDGANGDFTGGDYFNIRANNSAQLTFGYAGGEQLYFTSLGDLGLGSGAPAARFHINNTSDKKSIYLVSSSGGPSTHYPLQIEANNLTTAGCAYFYSFASSTNSRKLVYINNDNASASGTTCLRIKQDSTGTCLHFDTSTGIAMYSTDADIWGVVGRAKFGYMGHY